MGAAEKKQRLIEVSVDELQVGMYVNKLDRPWLDTPFLFQGFVIKDDDDLSQLRKHCAAVYVDPEESDAEIEFDRLSPATSAEPVKKPLIAARLVVSRITANQSFPEATVRVYNNVKDLRTALNRASTEYKSAAENVESFMQNLSAGGNLDMSVAKETVAPLVESVVRNPSAMSWLACLRDSSDYLYRHSIGSTIWASLLANHLGFPKEVVESAGLGAMLLDIGKTRLPQALLEKPGKLTPTERKLAETHVGLGMKILSDAGQVDENVVAMVQTHHERHDGSGYPNALAGDNIPVLGRIAGLVDFYDAVTSKRPYAEASSSYDCLRKLNHLAGKTFQAEIVEQFVQSIGFFPPGTLVELSDASVAAVVAQNRRHRLKPEVVLILDPDKQPLDDFPMIDLQTQPDSRFDKKPLHIERGLEPGSYDIDPSDYFL